MPIKVVLGRSIVNVRDILNLQKGDVITLDKSIDSELEIYVGNKVKFYCYPGLKKNKVAVKITRIEKRGDEIDE